MTVHCVFCNGTGVHECPTYAMNVPTLEDSAMPHQVCASCGNWLRVHWRGRSCYKPMPAHPAMLEHRRREFAR